MVLIDFSPIKKSKISSTDKFSDRSIRMYISNNASLGYILRGSDYLRDCDIHSLMYIRVVIYGTIETDKDLDDDMIIRCIHPNPTSHITTLNIFYIKTESASENINDKSGILDESSYSNIKINHKHDNIYNYEITITEPILYRGYNQIRPFELLHNINNFQVEFYIKHPHMMFDIINSPNVNNITADIREAQMIIKQKKTIIKISMYILYIY